MRPAASSARRIPDSAFHKFPPPPLHNLISPPVPPPSPPPPPLLCIFQGFSPVSSIARVFIRVSCSYCGSTVTSRDSLVDPWKEFNSDCNFLRKTSLFSEFQSLIMSAPPPGPPPPIFIPLFPLFHSAIKFNEMEMSIKRKHSKHGRESSENAMPRQHIDDITLDGA